MYVKLVDTEKEEVEQVFSGSYRKGDLFIQVVDEIGLKRLISWGKREEFPDETIWRDVLENYLDGDWKLLYSDELGALSENFFLSKEWIEAENGDILYVRTVYLYGDYMISDPLQRLLDDGYVVFCKEENDEELEKEEVQRLVRSNQRYRWLLE